MVKAGLILLAAAAMAFTHPRVGRKVAFEIHVRTLPLPVDFRSGERGDGGMQDFWTADIGLYAPTEKGRREHLRLLEISIADAQGREGPSGMRRLMAWFDSSVPRSGWEIID